MSLKYRDKNGAEVVLAGLTPGGNLETGAVATRSGIIKIPITASHGSGTIMVSFSEDMPDEDYVLNIVPRTSYYTLGADTYTKSGFRLIYQNSSTSSPSIEETVDYTAYKLYEVADAEELYSTVQDLEAMVPSNASSTNKFSTADDLRTETRTLDRRLDDVEDVIPTSASITNKLVTQSDLSGVEIDKVEDINDVELTNIQDGQTLIWDDANSKWVNGQGGKIYTAGDGIDISNTDEISAKVDDTSITTDTNDALKVADTYKTIFVGTQAQWDALSTADKIKYNEAHITDDVIGGEVADEVTDGLMSPVTSNAVYNYAIKRYMVDVPYTSSIAANTWVNTGIHLTSIQGLIYSCPICIKVVVNGYNASGFWSPSGVAFCQVRQTNGTAIDSLATSTTAHQNSLGASLTIGIGEITASTAVGLDICVKSSVLIDNMSSISAEVYFLENIIETN